nr:DUF411 domain-containing protein [uncultured Roseococcus sp.]
MKRRHLMAAIAAMAAGTAPAIAAGPLQLRVWRDPNCGCCTAWQEHMLGAGFQVEDNLVTSLAPTRRILGIPSDLASCHAGLVNGYALEGHVPAEAVLHLLSTRPAGVRGLAVPAMPIGSPGMEVPGTPDDTYDVIAFGNGGGRGVFMRFRGNQRV